MQLLDRDTIDIVHWCIRIRTAAEFYPRLRPYLNENGKIDLGNPMALSVYNQAVAKVIANLEIRVPHGHLIPTICLRHAYLVVLVENVLSSGNRILEIGTGSSAVLSLLAAKLYNLNVVATEIDDRSYKSANENIELNSLKGKITLLKSQGGIIHDLIENNETFDALLCYPPTYPEIDRKNFDDFLNLRGFQGTSSEMIGGGKDGFAFISQLIDEAHNIQIKHITLLLIFERHLGLAIEKLKGLNRLVKTVQLKAGTRTRFIIVGSINN